ncbi:recombinase family protein [Clostridium sp. Ade.TY]|uniref:recombinase family protein n=1 Tax=Clostridium sp. Ade.TY TaxID=1391647 RepID=UPI000424ECA7|nr:recombinase family protein [Clostridium sp. Ade.TY]
MIYGYVRVSTKTQNIDRQIKNILREYPNAILKEEKATGTKIEVRKVFKQLLKIVKKGDTIVFDSVSRMSRNAEEGFKLYQELFNRGIELVFLKENYINTSTYKKALNNNIQLTNTNVDSILKGVNEYLMLLAKEQIQIAFNQAEKEVKDLQQRTKEGIEVARAKGKQIGRTKGITIETDKAKECKKQILKHSKKFGGTLNNKECIEMLHIAKATFYKYVEELQNNN